MAMKTVILTFLKMLIGTSIAVHLIQGGPYAPVPNTFRSLFGRCTLNSYTMPNTRIGNLGCLQLCSAKPNCTLACYNGSACFLSSALVTPYWQPKASNDQPLLPFPSYQCYSSWIFQNDVTNKIAGVSSSGLFVGYGADFRPSYAIDGYYCDGWNAHFETARLYSNWYEIDMGKLFFIQMIVIKITNATLDGDTSSMFEGVISYVGNSSGHGSYSSYATLAMLSGRALHGQFVTFKSASPIVGRYISLQKPPYGYFGFGELKVVGVAV